MGTVSLIISIIGLISGFISPITGIVFAIFGLIFGIKASKENDKKGTAGIIISIIAIIIAIATFIIALTITTKSVTNTIDNSRRDTFVSVTNLYIDATRNAVVMNDLECTTNAKESSNDFKKINELGAGDYYIFFATAESAINSNYSSFPKELSKQAETQTNNMIEMGSKSSWQNEDVYGWVHINKNSDETKTYFVALTDVSGHGIPNELGGNRITRNDVLEKDAKADVQSIYTAINSDSNKYYCHYK